MKHYKEGADDMRVSTFTSNEEKKNFQKAVKWREPYLLKILVLFITLPLAAFSVLAYYVPYVFTIIPVLESTECWKVFEANYFTEN
jgi:hypothetical protein